MRMPLRLWRTATVCSSNDLSFSFVLSWRIGRSPEMWTRPFATMACGGVSVGGWVDVCGCVDGSSDSASEQLWVGEGMGKGRGGVSRVRASNRHNIDSVCSNVLPPPRTQRVRFRYPCASAYLAVMPSCWGCKVGDDRLRLRGLGASGPAAERRSPRPAPIRRRSRTFRAWCCCLPCGELVSGVSIPIK